ncbi:MAG: class I SAM-dependent methyltransferase, partial [Eubacterium sp.]|nr:class I SAM-dependent methyltransferase [Eubacterium sp.]
MINTDFLKNEAAQMGVSLDAAAIKRFELLADRLVSWNSRVNLTAITAPDDIVVKHFLDSISPLPYADIKENARLIDVGCGAGFPGLPILIARPDIEVTFLD